MTAPSEAQAFPNIDFTPDTSKELEMAIRAVQQGLRSVEIVYASHPRWPLPHRVLPNPSFTAATTGTEYSPETSLSARRSLQISVLDSSFNPPTLAHLALARSKPPTSSFSQAAAPIQEPAQQNTSGGLLTGVRDYDYDARLLLLSVRNADKALKPGDATFSQRLEMMTHLARSLQQEEDTDTPSSSRVTGSSTSPGAACRHDALIGNIAVAIIDEPTFVRKSAVLRDYLNDRVASLFHDRNDSLPPAGDLHMKVEGNAPEVCLTFLMGFDTLERFLAPRYYGGTLESMHTALNGFFSHPPEGDGSKVVCARRGRGSSEALTIAHSVTAQQMGDEYDENESDAMRGVREVLVLAKPYIEAGTIALTDLTDWEMRLSSSEVRTRCAARDEEWRMMVHSSVANYIEKFQLYRVDNSSQ